MRDVIVMVAGQPFCCLESCPPHIIASLQHELYTVVPRSGDDPQRCQLRIRFTELPDLPVEQALRGVLHRCGSRYFAFDRHGERYELPFSLGGDWSAIELQVSPRIAAGFFIPNVLLPLFHIGLGIHHGSLIHAAAVDHHGTALVIAGWGGTGKTSTLLAMLRRHRCHFLGDDLSVLSHDRVVHRLGRTINVLDYNLASYPELRRFFSRKALIAAAARSTLNAVAARSRRILGGDSIVASAAARLAADAKAIANVKLAAERLAPKDTEGPSSAPIGTLFMIERGELSSPQPFHVSGEQAAQALAAALVREFTKLLDVYYAYCGMIGTKPISGFADFSERTVSILTRLCQGLHVIGMRLPIAWDDYDAVADRLIELSYSPRADLARPTK